jgi:hypothetical protein
VAVSMGYELYTIREDNQNNLIAYKELVNLVDTYSDLELRIAMEIMAQSL